MSWFKDDVLEGLLADQNERLKQQNAWLQSQVEDLQNKVLEMKQQGFVHEPTIVRDLPEQGLPDVVDSAISQRASPNSALWGDLSDYAEAMIRNGVDPEHVADNILTGGSDA